MQQFHISLLIFEEIFFGISRDYFHDRMIDVIFCDLEINNPDAFNASICLSLFFSHSSVRENILADQYIEE